MKKLIGLLIVSLCVVGLFAQIDEGNEKEPPERILKIRKAYAYVEEELLVSQTDLDCTFIITNEISRDIQIIGAKEMDLGREGYSDGDLLYINRGMDDGIKSGDVFLILAKGPKISHPHRVGGLGTYYLKKSLAEVTMVYENKATIMLKNGCNPVYVKDILIPYKKEDTIFMRRIDYKLSRLPESEAEGRVVYLDLYMGQQMEISGANSFVAVDLDKSMVQKGDFLLFYKFVKKNLPPIIIGSGIVVHPMNTNSTVKILDSAYPLEIGTHAVKLPYIPELYEKGDKIPVMDALKKDKVDELKAQDAETLNLEILYNMDDSVVAPQYLTELERIREFLKDKTQYIIILRGYTCSVGNQEYNLNLSQKRVEAVKEILTRDFNIDENLIEANFYGEKEADYNNTLEEQRRKNRRVTIEVTAK